MPPNYPRCYDCTCHHDPAVCCECGASATGFGRFGYLCPDHGYEAHEDSRADALT